MTAGVVCSGMLVTLFVCLLLSRKTFFTAPIVECENYGIADRREERVSP